MGQLTIVGFLFWVCLYKLNGIVLIYNTSVRYITKYLKLKYDMHSFREKLIAGRT